MILLRRRGGLGGIHFAMDFLKQQNQRIAMEEAPALKDIISAHNRSVLVIGLGVMGLLHLMLARRLGASPIIGADRVPFRLARAADAGADVVVDVQERSLPEAVAAMPVQQLPGKTKM